jgi:hypothetical protein
MPREPGILLGVQELGGQNGGYRVERQVARGRSGEVLCARAADGSLVAIKVFDRVADADVEARRLAAVDHPSVVSLLDRGVGDDGRHWLALVWAEGRTLSNLLASESPMSLDRVIVLVARLAEAVDALHEAGVVHGDLSPNNVMVDDDDRITLIDLGQTAPTRASLDATTGVEVTTTPRYAAPEVAGGAMPEPASDRYAVALIAYEAATGEFPFPEVSTPIAMLGHHASSKPVAPSEHRPGLPAPVDAALLWGLDKDPADRPGSAADLAEAMAATHVPPHLAARLPEAPVGRKRWWAMAGVAAVAVLAIVLAPSWPGAGDSPSVAAAAWESGAAAGMACNLLEVPGFETGAVLDGFYGGDPTNTTALAEGAGVGGSTALRVGSGGEFGLAAEIVPIGSESRFVFSAWIREQGEPQTTAMYVDYLGEDYLQITHERDSVSVGSTIGDPAGSRVTITSEAPAGAAFAVPTVFKDGSAGSVLVDEVVFGPVDVCPDLGR